MHINRNEFIVNKPFLYFDENNTPTVQDLDGSERQFPPSQLGRWLIRTLYTSMMASPEAAVWFAQENPTLYTPIPHLVHTPQGAYQTLALYRMLLENCALWLDMGLGKTYLALAFALRVLADGNGNGSNNITMIICPTSVFFTWHEEIEKHVSTSARPVELLAHGPRRKKTLLPLKQGSFDPQQPIFIFTSYETLKNVAQDLENIRISNIFFDESSKIKNMKSQRTQSAHAFVRSHPEARVFCLSGTPSTTTPEGFYSQYEILGRGFSGFPDALTFQKEFVDSAMFARCLLPTGREIHIQTDKTYQDASGEEEHAFAHWLRSNKPVDSPLTYYSLGYRFSKTRGDRVIRILNFYPRFYGTKNIDRLRKITQTRAYSVKKEDVAKDLPSKTYVTRTVELTEEQTKAYQDILNKQIVGVAGIRFRFNDHTGPFAKLHQVCQGYVKHEQDIMRFNSNPKAQEIISIVEESGDQKIIIWSSFIEQIHILEEAFENEDIPTRTIYGAVSINDRSEIIQELRASNDCRILIANPEVAGMGLNLTFATLEIFASNWYKPDTRIQAEDRCHRLGQHNPVTIIDVIAEGTLEIALLRNARKKIDTENQILTHKQLLGE